MHFRSRDTGLAAGAPEGVVLAGSNTFRITAPVRLKQAEYLLRRYRLMPSHAAVIADLLFGEAGR
jgi:hypothetical protein